MQWRPDGLTLHTKKWFLGAGLLRAPPISLTGCPGPHGGGGAVPPRGRGGGVVARREATTNEGSARAAISMPSAAAIQLPASSASRTRLSRWFRTISRSRTPRATPASSHIVGMLSCAYPHLSRCFNSIFRRNPGEIMVASGDIPVKVW